VTPDIKPVVLLGAGGERHMIRPGTGMRQVHNLGVVDTDRLALATPGSAVSIAGKEFTVLEASLLDMLACMRRGPQIIVPKDAAQILIGCCIGPGMRVLEVGAGSGAMTMVLASAVGLDGKVVSYESSPKHAKIARANLESAGLAGTVELREADAGTCADSEAYHAAVIDMPEPWGVLGAVTGALRPGSYICAYVPTMNQAERTVRAMRDSGFAETRALENIQREIEVGEGGTRPSFEMLGHTGYLCFGRKLRP